MNRKMQWLRNKLLSMDLQGMIVSNPVNIIENKLYNTADKILTEHISSS